MKQRDPNWRGIRRHHVVPDKRDKLTDEKGHYIFGRPVIQLRSWQGLSRASSTKLSAICMDSQTHLPSSLTFSRASVWCRIREP